MSSQYDLDGQLCMRIDGRPAAGARVPLRNVGAVNWCQFRGMLMKSSIYFSDRAEVAVGPWASAQLLIGDHPRMAPLRNARPAEQAAVHGGPPHSTVCSTTTSSRGSSRRPRRSGTAPITAATPWTPSTGLPRSTDWLDPPSAGGRLGRESS